MSKIKEAKSFWEWFMSNEDVYLNFRNAEQDEKEKLLDGLFAELQNYSKELGFLLNFKRGPRPQLTITAKGNADLLEDVMFLTHHAPLTDNWNFINFISQTEVPYGFSYQGVLLHPDNIYFTARRNNKRYGLLDLCLYIKASKKTMQSEDLYDAANLLLLHLLGETNFAACIGTFSVRDMPVGPIINRLQKLRELPEFVSVRNVIKKLVPAMENQGIVV
ncbi:hypothetical protein [Chitinophaga ginsengisoli]|uniref:Uncharacterized protein n=1 Tax=Chitinophaga ginsengisoli TaxID=363837 RepID=A0A2P8G4P8_9BACT|nr:hypothetical protein [Chitinophaga ginsengisoli]PSL28953.1 hypothetical protein CLV42_10799 [Chitinophaga ginsengisoli]